MKNDTNWVHFTRTHWSIVWSAKENPTSTRQQALEELCQTYWKPIYAFIRQRGYASAEAQDLTQEFFARMLAKDYLQYLQHQEGKFRSFLLTFVKHLLSNERDKRKALKRGGDRTFIPLEDFQAVEKDLPRDSHLKEQDEATFDRHWARSILDQAAHRLESEYQEKGKGDLYKALNSMTPDGEGNQAYADLAQQFRMNEPALRTAAHRLRKRYGELIREEVLATVNDPSEVEEEIRYLIKVAS